MPRNFIYETAITIDHEDDVMLVDTTVASMATQLRRCGFIETTKASSHPYRRFRGNADQFRFRKPKGQRSVGGAAKQRMENARSGRPGAQTPLPTKNR